MRQDCGCFVHQRTKIPTFCLRIQPPHSSLISPLSNHQIPNPILKYPKNLLHILLHTKHYISFRILQECYNLIEEMQREFVIAVVSKDGRQMNMQVRQKSHQLSKRKVKTWTNQEDLQLLELYDRLPKKWSEIAELMTDRNQNQCLHRYRRLVQLGQSHKIWSAQEDQTILRLIKKYGKNWKLISEMLGSKNGKQIRERYINKLDPRIKREDWSEEEDKRILELYSKVGSKWSEISKSLPGRPENKIKNRFYSFIQKNYDIKFKEVSPAIDPSAKENDGFTPFRVPDAKSTLEARSQHILEQKQENKQSQQRICSKFNIPSINQIDFQAKHQPQLSNNLLQSVLRVDQDWRAGNAYGNYSNCQSILELRSTDFFPKCS